MTLVEFIRHHGGNNGVGGIESLVRLSDVLEFASEEVLVEMGEFFADRGVDFGNELSNWSLCNTVLYIIRGDGKVHWGRS